MTQWLPPSLLPVARRGLVGAAALALLACSSRGDRHDTVAAGAIGDTTRADTARRDTTRADTTRAAAAASTAPTARDTARARTPGAGTPSAGTAARRDTMRRDTARVAQRGAQRGAAATRGTAPATGAQSTSAPTASNAAPSQAAPQSAPSQSAPSQAAAGAAGADSAKGAQAGKKDMLLASTAEYNGWKIFHVYCFRCHGVDAFGGQLAPDLRHSVGPLGSVTHEVFLQTVTNGRLEKGMPSWKTLLDTAQMENIWAYLKARSEGRLAPGRPHQATQGSSSGASEAKQEERPHGTGT
jgi:mono/diheme cytochrome c family protein